MLLLVIMLCTPGQLCLICEVTVVSSLYSGKKKCKLANILLNSFSYLSNTSYCMVVNYAVDFHKLYLNQLVMSFET